MPAAAASTASSSVRPPTRCSTLGRAERIRDPIPAARMTTRGLSPDEPDRFERDGRFIPEV